MLEINIHEAKTNLSRYINQLKTGERIVICNRRRPVAEIRLLDEPKSRKRRIGLAKGELTVPDDFFEPLPREVVESFYPQAQVNP